MKKSIFFAIALVCAHSAYEVHAASFTNRLLTTLSRYGRGVVSYVCSKNGIKDACAAYGLGMVITTAHELGHALTGKLFFGAPIDITIGKKSSKTLAEIALNRPPIVRIGGFKLGGFNPATGYSRSPFMGCAEVSRGKRALTLLAGPVMGIVSSLCAFALLKKFTRTFYLAKAVSLFGLYNHTLGPNGIGGFFWGPGSDPHRIRQYLRGAEVF